jgi:hypothetical protein
LPAAPDIEKAISSGVSDAFTWPSEIADGIYQATKEAMTGRG